jgi:polyisoprenoid-binding protein YceI
MHSGTQRGLAAVKFLIDAAASRFTVQASATGLLSAFGHNPTIAIRDYEGEIQFASDTYQDAHVRVTVRTAGMEVLDEMKKDDREKLEKEMNDKVLEVARFPTAVFENKQLAVDKLSDSLLHARVTGELSFHGVTRSHSLQARVTNIGSMLRISGDFSLRQSDYEIKPASFAAGALRLKDEVKFNFELVARKQE